MTQSFTVRRAQPVDASGVSALFQTVYGTTSHPFRSPDVVARFAADPRNVQVLAEQDGSVIATMAVQYCQWNNTYEWGRGVTDPSKRGLGLAENLTQQAFSLTRDSGLGDLFFGYPRVKRILDLCSLVEPRLTVVGHDGGENIANGRREAHLMVCGAVANRRFVHVAPDHRSDAKAMFEFRFYQPLGLSPVYGAYPADTIVGPVDSATEYYNGLAVDFDRRSVNRAAHIVGQYTTLSTSGLVASLAALDSCIDDLQQISVMLLADKSELIGDLLMEGFECSAYLPAWFADGDRRFDCLTLVKRLHSEPVRCAMPDELRRADEALHLVHDVFMQQRSAYDR